MMSPMGDVYSKYRIGPKLIPGEHRSEALSSLTWFRQDRKHQGGSSWYSLITYIKNCKAVRKNTQYFHLGLERAEDLTQNELRKFQQKYRYAMRTKGYRR